jgi:predicted nucleic acid-binding protein
MVHNSIFVDTSAWFALSDLTDSDYAMAVAFAQQCKYSLVTTDYIVDELLTLFVKRRFKSLGLSWLKKVLFPGGCELIQVGEADFREACDMYVRFADKDWSFTDCTSLVVMRRLGIRRAFAFDRHFRQFGDIQVFPE